MTNKRVILHIGLPKCASTSLQYALSNSEEIDYVGFIPDSDNFHFSDKEFASLFDCDLRFNCNNGNHYKKIIKNYIKNSKKNIIFFSSESISLRFLSWDLPTHIKLKFINTIFPSNTEFLFIYKHPLNLLKSLYKEWVLLGSYIGFTQFVKDIYQYKKISFFNDILLNRFEKQFNSIFEQNKLNVLFLEENLLTSLNEFLNTNLITNKTFNTSINDYETKIIRDTQLKFDNDYSFFDRIEKHRAFYDIDNNQKYTTSRKRRARKEQAKIIDSDTSHSCIKMIDFSLIEPYNQILNDLMLYLKSKGSNRIIEQYIDDLTEIVELSKL